MAVSDAVFRYVVDKREAFLKFLDHTQLHYEVVSVKNI